MINKSIITILRHASYYIFYTKRYKLFTTSAFLCLLAENNNKSHFLVCLIYNKV